MYDQIDYDTMTRMLRSAAERIRAEREVLSALDAAIGDGDHGTAMSKVADAIVQTIASRGDRSLPAMLADVGWAAMGTDAGSTGPLYGSLFVGMSAAVGEAPLDLASFTSMIEAGVANLRKQTRAAVGDKTMLDALIPACQAIRDAADDGQTAAVVLEVGADAALAGAESTAELRARFGRAKNLGERSIGHKDPGAVSMSLFFAGLSEGFAHAGS